MSLLLYDIENEVEYMLDKYDMFTNKIQRQVLKYSAFSLNTAQADTGTSSVPEFQISGKEIDDLNDNIKKLNYLVQDGKKILLISSETKIASYGYLESISTNLISKTSEVSSIDIDFVCNADVIGTGMEAENCTLTNGTVIDDLDASNRKTVKTDMMFENVYLNINQNNILLPLGNYTMWIRARGEQTSHEVTMYVYNYTDSSYVQSSYTSYLALEYAWHKLNFTIMSDDLTDNIRFVAENLNLGAYNVFIDMICFVRNI